MTSTSITAPGLSGVLRMTWVHDDLAHVLEHADTDEPSGTWTGLACRDHDLPLGGDVDNATLRRLAADGKIADLVWEAPEELAAEHAQSFHAAMRALPHRAFRGRPNSNGSRCRRSGHGPGLRTTRRSNCYRTRGSRRSRRSNRSAGSVASFEHHCGPHGLPHPHIHNIVITRLTTGTPAN